MFHRLFLPSVFRLPFPISFFLLQCGNVLRTISSIPLNLSIPCAIEKSALIFSLLFGAHNV